MSDEYDDSVIKNIDDYSRFVNSPEDAVIFVYKGQKDKLLTLAPIFEGLQPKVAFLHASHFKRSSNRCIDLHMYAAQVCLIYYSCGQIVDVPYDLAERVDAHEQANNVLEISLIDSRNGVIAGDLHSRCKAVFEGLEADDSGEYFNILSQREGRCTNKWLAF
ncbi:hypothetical protein GGF42_004092 [Coemansia sp. RSA 2424]|nr:hypothetical protein GGF42_004092 [Coemansia sp. RSA 2424]